MEESYFETCGYEYLYESGYEYLYESVVKYISLDATAYQDFIDWLNNARIDDTADVCVMALPEPRLDFYHSSDYDVI